MKTVLSILKRISYDFAKISKNESNYRNSMNFTVDRTHRRIKISKMITLTIVQVTSIQNIQYNDYQMQVHK